MVMSVKHALTQQLASSDDDIRISAVLKASLNQATIGQTSTDRTGTTQIGTHLAITTHEDTDLAAGLRFDRWKRLCALSEAVEAACALRKSALRQSKSVLIETIAPFRSGAYAARETLLMARWIHALEREITKLQCSEEQLALLTGLLLAQSRAPARSFIESIMDRRSNRLLDQALRIAQDLNFSESSLCLLVRCWNNDVSRLETVDAEVEHSHSYLFTAHSCNCPINVL